MAKIKDAEDLKDELSRLYFATKQGKVDPATSGKLCYILQTMAKTMQMLEQKDDAPDSIKDLVDLIASARQEEQKGKKKRKKVTDS
jgi:hypothetical protein